MQFLGEEPGALLPVQMDSGHDHVGGLLACHGQHPFPQVSFPDMQTLFLKGLVQMDFLSSHRLGLHNAVNLLLLTDLQQDFLHLVTVLGPEELPAPGLDGGFEFICHLINVIHRPVLHLLEVIPQAVYGHHIVIGLETGSRVFADKAGKGIPHDTVLQFHLDFLVQISAFLFLVLISEFSCCHFNAPALPSPAQLP